MSSGTVTELYRYPVKSLQGLACSSLQIESEGVAGDRQWALIDVETETLMSAKRWSRLFEASAGEAGIDLPDGTHVPYQSPDVDTLLSAWMGRPVRLARAGTPTERSYEMTFDPPDDSAEYYAIPAPAGTFVDLAAVHLVSTSTLAAGVDARPDLDWDVRRFRPNVVIDAEVEPFGEDAWTGTALRVGAAVLSVSQPTVRCAMPLRAQPGLDRQPELYSALDDLHDNHLGIYLDIVEPGRIAVGDPVTSERSR